MAYLSHLDEDRIAVGLANPICLTSVVDIRQGAKLTFEVLEADASALKSLVGKLECYGLGPEHPLFYARLTHLDRCRSTTLALAMMREAPTLCGTFAIESVLQPEEKNLA